MPYTRTTFDELSEGPAPVLRLLRKDMGITAFGANVIELPPGASGPEHTEEHTGQEELYVGIEGSGTVEIDGERVPIGPRVAISLTPDAKRRVVAGDQGLTYVGIGGVPGGVYEAPEAFS